MNILKKWTTAIVLVLLLVSAGWAGEIPQAKPESVGMSSAKLAKVSAAVGKMVDDKKIAGAITIVARKGKIVHFETYGMRDIESKKPVEKDTIMRFYSMTKPITTVAAMILFDQGKFKLDDPLENYLPELKGLKVQNGDKTSEPARKVTIRDIMRHTSGFTYGLFGNTRVDQMYRKANILGSRNLKEMVTKLGKIPLRFEPGSQWHYSVSSDVLGALVERISKTSLDAFFKRHIFGPLDMKDTGFSVPKSSVERFSSCFRPGLRVEDKYSTSHYTRPPRGMLSGGGGLVSTARDYMRFCQMLVNKGRFQGKRILKAKTVEMMTVNNLPEGVYVRRGTETGFGLGFSVQLKDRGAIAHAGEYGWGGAASTHFWISPKDDLVVIALSQYKPFSSKLKQLVKPLVYEAIVK
ncbi:MAG: serine hydrolase domain-containing protein [Phycisphaerae bacterium]|nr:serine hydrolase domain-containing protein [Phycisphaerae bacterium]